MRKDQNSKREGRLNAKRFFLTYSQVPEALDAATLLLRLQAKVDFSQYLIGEESHKDGGKHFHVVLLSNKRRDVSIKTTFNIEFEGVEYRSNCQKITNLKYCIQYASKGKKVTTNITNLEDGVILSTFDIILRMAQKVGVSKAMAYYIENYPKEAFKSRSLLPFERSLTRAAELKRGDLTSTRDALSTPFSVKDFDLPEKLQRWIDSGYQPTLILVGPPGCGKTQFVKALASLMGWNMLILNHKESLKKLSGEHDGIFYDDMSFKDVDDFTLLAMFESVDNRDIRILNKVIDKRGGLIQIFALNKKVFQQIRWTTMEGSCIYCHITKFQ